MAQCRHLILILHRKACYFENSVLPDDRLLFATLGRSAFFYNFSIMSCLFELVIQSILLLFPLIGGLQWKLFFFSRFSFFCIVILFRFVIQVFCSVGALKRKPVEKNFFYVVHCFVLLFFFVL